LVVQEFEQPKTFTSIFSSFVMIVYHNTKIIPNHFLSKTKKNFVVLAKWSGFAYNRYNCLN
ncbi:MAG: hypothetical protein IJX25_04225, partial [Clostridia bacterium]|nr:hypothetical protein [Clostridia bacterium]